MDKKTNETPMKKTIHLKLGKVCIGSKKPVCRSIPLSPNRLNTMHWAIKMAWKNAWKEEVWGRWLEIRKDHKDIKFPLEKVKITPYVFYSKLQQDMDNQIASLKPVIDGLTECGVIVDDNPHCVNLEMPTYVHCKKDQEHIELVIEVLNK